MFINYIYIYIYIYIYLNIKNKRKNGLVGLNGLACQLSGLGGPGHKVGGLEILTWFTLFKLANLYLDRETKSDLIMQQSHSLAKTQYEDQKDTCQQEKLTFTGE